MSSNQQKSNVTLDQAFQAVSHWRNNKDQYENRGIPDNVWKLVFQLENQGYLPKDLKRALSLNSKQYDEKKNQIVSTLAKTAEKINDLKAVNSGDDGSNIFCEAKIKPVDAPAIPSLSDAVQKNKQAVATLKSTINKPQDYLDMTTIIVEYIRPDGHRLKIHTTSESIHKVMSAFARQGTQVND